MFILRNLYILKVYDAKIFVFKWNKDNHMKNINCPVFYLKIHSESDYALECFMQWVKICELSKADFFVVCDKEQLKEKIATRLKENGWTKPLNFIESYREQLREIFESVFLQRWINTCYALLTPVVHAKENGFSRIWNVDSDDTMIYAKPEHCVEMLKCAAKYADENRLDLFGLDIWQTVSHTWTFGITYMNMETDFLGATALIKKKYPDKNYNQVDALFRFAINEKILSGKVFYCENLVFEHVNHCMVVWKNDGLKHLECVPRYHDARARHGSLVEISEQSIGLDYKFPEKNDFQEKIDKRRNHYDLIWGDKPFIKNEMVDCYHFSNYILSLFDCAFDLVVFITTSDTHTSFTQCQRKLRLLYALGIKTDLEKTFRHSWLAVFDGGVLKQELLSENTKLVSTYSFDGHSAEVISQGWNCCRIPDSPVSVKIDGVEYAVNKRGLNFVVFDKKKQKVIDSVCFDTYCTYIPRPKREGRFVRTRV